MIAWKELVELIKSDPRLVILVAIGFLLLFILIIIFIQNIFSEPKPKKKSFTPADPEKVNQFGEKLSLLSEDGKQIIEYLDNEVQTKSQLVEQKTKQLETLDQQKKELEENLRMLREQPNEFAEMMQKAHKQEIKDIEKKARQLALRRWIWGFIIGILLSASAVAVYLYAQPLTELYQNLMQKIRG
jgi:uncharacterized membrane protein YvbJ